MARSIALPLALALVLALPTAPALVAAASSSGDKSGHKSSSSSGGKASGHCPDAESCDLATTDDLKLVAVAAQEAVDGVAALNDLLSIAKNWPEWLVRVGQAECEVISPGIERSECRPGPGATYTTRTLCPEGYSLALQGSCDASILIGGRVAGYAPVVQSGTTDNFSSCSFSVAGLAPDTHIIVNNLVTCSFKAPDSSNSGSDLSVPGSKKAPTLAAVKKDVKAALAKLADTRKKAAAAMVDGLKAPAPAKNAAAPAKNAAAAAAPAAKP